MTACFPAPARLDEASPAKPTIFDIDPRGETAPWETTRLSGEHMEYTPYGQQWIDEGSDKSIITYRFTSKEYDTETGLYYYGKRYLDPVSARWISPDPGFVDFLPQTPTTDEIRKENTSLPGGGGVFNYLNLDPYLYSENNPVRYFDPTGSHGEVVIVLVAVVKVGQFWLGTYESQDARGVEGMGWFHTEGGPQNLKVEPFSGGLVIRNTNVEDAFKNGDFHPFPSSGLLGKNLSIVGENRVGNEEAHHIVPASAARAAVARDILHDYGIDINAPENGGKRSLGRV